MRRLLYLGDIHGNFNLIKHYIKHRKITNADIIQVGDFGVGFNRFKHEKNQLEFLNETLVEFDVHVYAIRGNHDYKPYFDNDPFGLSNITLVPDYTVLNINDRNILCIGGAVSVDRTWRYTAKQERGIYEGYQLGIESWWDDEVFLFDLDKLKEFRDIHTVVTHTAPEYCTIDNRMGFGGFVEGIFPQDPELKTDLLHERYEMTYAFQVLKEHNNIEYAYYGHFHRSDVLNYDGTCYRLLNIGELYEERF